MSSIVQEVNYLIISYRVMVSATRLHFRTVVNIKDNDMMVVRPLVQQATCGVQYCVDCLLVHLNTFVSWSIITQVGQDVQSWLICLQC